MKITIGSDPEFFLSDGKATVSAHDLLPGTKAEPFPVPGGAVQVDGTAVEYNIDAAASPDEFVTNHLLVQKRIRELIDKARPGLLFTFRPYTRYEPEYFKSLPRTAKILGCDPDYNAYTGRPNIMALGENTPFRTAAGHVHIGWTGGVDPRNNDHFWRCQIMSKVLDEMVLEPYNRMIDKENPQRQKYYGAAGAFRPKPYGCEYRALSNVWCSQLDLMEWVFNRVQKAVQLLVTNQIPANAMVSNPTSVKSPFWAGLRKEWAADLKPLTLKAA